METRHLGVVERNDSSVSSTALWPTFCSSERCLSRDPFRTAMWVLVGNLYRRTCPKAIPRSSRKKDSQFLLQNLVDRVISPQPTPTVSAKSRMDRAFFFGCWLGQTVRYMLRRFVSCSLSYSVFPSTAFERVYDSWIRKGQVEDGVSEQMADFDHQEVSGKSCRNTCVYT